MKKAEKKLNSFEDLKDIVIDGTPVMTVVRNDFAEDSNEEENLEKEMQEFMDKKEKQTQKVLTIDEKINRINELSLLSKRREDLYFSKKTLSDFKLGNTGENQKLTLFDASGRNFNISNSEAIKIVIESLNNFLTSKINEVEKQIDF